MKFCRGKVSFAVKKYVLQWKRKFCRGKVSFAVADMGHRSFPPNVPGKTWKLTSNEKQFISPEEDVTILLFRPRIAKNE